MKQFSWGCRRRVRPPVGWHVAGFILAAVLLTTGCATPQLTDELLSNPPAGLPVRVELSEVPFFPQEQFQCGPAALAEVLQHRGVETSPDALKREVYLPERQGSLQLELVAAARGRGLVVYPLEPELGDLVEEVAAGNPVLVLQNLSLPFYPVWHYAVVIGFDLAAETLTLRSGTNARQETPLATFERTWARGNHWGVVVMPPDRLPATADPLRYVTAVQALEAVGQVAPAHHAYRTALNAWPRDEIALFGRGNTAYALEDFVTAESAFRGLIDVAPLNVAAWNNLAYALVARACDHAAVEAAECALALAPEDENVLATVVDILKLAGRQPDDNRCAPVRCPKPVH